MQLLPDREQGRPLALILLAIVLLLVYLLCFHWFIQRHREYASNIADLREQLGSVQLRLAQRDQLEERLEALRTERQDDAFFLQENNFDAAAAQLAARLKGIITTQAEDAQNCTVQSTQNMRPRSKERFEKVIVKVRMKCSLSDFVKVLDELESGVPLVFLDKVNLYQQARIATAARRNNRRRGRVPVNVMDIRFDMNGYIRSSEQKT